MPRNVEIKAKVTEPEVLFAKAKALASTDGTVLEQEDTFFNVPNGRLKLRCTKGNKAQLIHYSRPDQNGPKLSDFNVAVIDDATTLKTLLSNAMGVKGEVKKSRRLIMLDQTRIHLDEVQGLGHFMELEVLLHENQTVNDGEKIAEDIMDKLGIKKDDLLDGAYMDLLLKDL